MSKTTCSQCHGPERPFATLCPSCDGNTAPTFVESQQNYSPGNRFSVGHYMDSIPGRLSEQSFSERDFREIQSGNDDESSSPKVLNENEVGEYLESISEFSEIAKEVVKESRQEGPKFDVLKDLVINRIKEDASFPLFYDYVDYQRIYQDLRGGIGSSSSALTPTNFIYPGIGLVPNNPKVASYGTVGGCFWHFTPRSNGSHYMWLVAPGTFEESPPPIGSRILHFLRRWKAKNIKPVLEHGGLALKGELTPVLLTNWHNVQHSTHADNQSRGEYGQAAAIGKSLKVESSARGMVGDYRVGDVVASSVPRNESWKAKGKDDRPDAVLVKIENIRTSYPMDLPIILSRNSKMSTPEYLKLLSILGRIAKRDKWSLAPVAKIIKHVRDLDYLENMGTLLTPNSIWPWLRKVRSDNRLPPEFVRAAREPWTTRWFRPPYICADPNSIKKGDEVFKISTALSFGGARSGVSDKVYVGYGVVKDSCRSKDSQNVTCTVRLGNHRFFKFFDVEPKTKSKYDMNQTGNSGSLVFKMPRNGDPLQLAGILSGSRNLAVGDWVVHHIYDVIDAFDGFLITSPVTFTKSEFQSFLSTGIVPAGCGVFEPFTTSPELF